MISSSLRLATFELCVALFGAVVVCAGSLFYLRRVRLERPAIGTFNGRDVGVLFVLLATLPVFYLHLPRWLLTTFLAVTFAASLSIGFRPVLSPGRLWLGIGVLLGANIWMGNNLLGTVVGWQAFWAENSLIVVLGAVSVANLYVQGGMKLRHVAWFAIGLAVYDVFFSTAIHVTNALVEQFLGYPLIPAVGMRVGFDNASIGLGDLFVYGLFVVAAFKAYGRGAARLAFGIVIAFGAAMPALAPLAIDFVDSRTDVLVPAQAWFGPAAFLGYLWMRRRYGRERTMKDFLASSEVGRRVAPSPAAPAVPAPTAAPTVAPEPAPERVDVST